MFLRSLSRRLALRPSRLLPYCVDPSSPSSPKFEKFSEFDVLKEGNLPTALASNDEWVVQEKVHGANFSIHAFGRASHIKYAKRSGFIDPSEYFFGYTKLVPQFTQQLPLLQTALETHHGPVESFILYGEVFGGRYTHPEVSQAERFTEFRGQQRRIAPVQADFVPQYSPDLHFYAYELALRPRADAPWSTLTADEANTVFESVPALLFARVLFRGTMAQCLSFDLDRFESLIPHLLGLGAFVLPRNYAEGIVLRRASRGGLTASLVKSTIVKMKQRGFQESRHGAEVRKGMGVEEARGEQMRQNGETVVRSAAVLSAGEHGALDALRGRVGPATWAAVCEAQGGPFESPAEAVAALAKGALTQWMQDTEACPDSVASFSHSTRRHTVNYLRIAAEKFVANIWKEYKKAG